MTYRRRACAGMSLAEEWFEVLALVLGDHFAAVVMQEAIGHHAVEAGDAGDLVNRQRQQVFHAGLALDALDGLMRGQGERLQRHGIGGPLFKFGDEHAFGFVRDQVEGTGGQRNDARVDVAMAVFQCRLDHGAGRSVEMGLVQGLSHLRQVAQQGSRIGAARGKLALGREAQEGTMILDGSGDVDRLLITIAQVDRSPAACVIRIAHSLLSRCLHCRTSNCRCADARAPTRWRAKARASGRPRSHVRQMLAHDQWLRWKTMRILGFGKCQL